MRHICYFCQIRSVQELINKFNPDDATADEFIKAIHKMLSENWDQPNPLIATYIYRYARKILKIEDLYAEEKEQANSALFKDYDYWENYVKSSENPFQTAVKLAVVGNIIDYGAHSLKGELIDQIKKLLAQPFVLNEANALYTSLKQAKNVLYLGDNAGEIVFDKLFIEIIGHNNLTYVVRGKPVINDVTLADAKRIGFQGVCNLMDNGSDAPSTLLPLCSADFVDAYNKADLIISKGQGNFEGLMYEKRPKTFFLLIAKCKPIADLLKIDPMSLVITKY